MNWSAKNEDTACRSVPWVVTVVSCCMAVSKESTLALVSPLIFILISITCCRPVPWVVIVVVSCCMAVSKESTLALVAVVSMTCCSLVSNLLIPCSTVGDLMADLCLEDFDQLAQVIVIQGNV